MKFAVLYSKKDEAGITIAEQLKNSFLPHIPIIELSKDSIYSERIDKKEEQLKNVDFILFATKHQSKENRKTLSLHAPGNWRNNEIGGKFGKVCRTSSLAMKFLFQKMQENMKKENSDYELTLECTHHGPLIEKPCCFIEIGTTQEQWKDKKAAKIIAQTISDFQNFEEFKLKEKSKNIKSTVAIGGPHYCNSFNKIQLSEKSNIAISHIIPEYSLPLTESMISEAIEKTLEKTDLIIMDWKGCGNSENRTQVQDICKKTGIPIERTEKIDK